MKSPIKDVSPLHQGLLPVPDHAVNGEAAAIEDAEHDMDFLLVHIGRSPGRYQLLLFTALCSCMFPVVFNDLCTIFYAIPPVFSYCDITEPVRKKIDPLGNGDLLTTYAAELLDTFRSGFDNLTDATERAGKTQLRVDFGDVSSCMVYDGLNDEQTALCDASMEHSFNYSEINSVVSEWNLVCGRYWKVNFATTVYFMGVMVGSLAFGQLADKIGRKRCVDICYLGYLPLAIGLAYASYYWLFLLLRFWIGFFIQGLQSVCFVLLMEYCAPQYREIVGGIQGSLNNFGIIVLSGASYWWRDWRKIQLCITIPTFLALAKILFVRESLRWQMVHGKIQETKETIHKILKWNRLPVNPQLDVILDRMSAKLQAEQELQSQYSCLDCFRTPRIRRYTIVQSFLWFTTLFVYYGISFSMGELSGNVYLNAICAAAAEIPAAAFAVYFMRRFGRRRPLIFYYGICGILCTVAGFLSFVTPDMAVDWNIPFDTIRTVAVFAARFSLAGTYAIIMVFGSELFPTVIRNVGFGICICCHTAGGIVVPQVLLLGHLVHDALPFLIFGACSLISAALVNTQPETLNRKMPDTIEEVEGDFSQRINGKTVTSRPDELVSMVHA